MSYTKEEIYSPQTTEQIAAHVKEILRLLGEDTSREGLLKTPERVAKALQFTTKGYSEDGIEIIRQAIFDEGQALRDAVENDEVRRFGYVFWSEEKLKVLPKQWRDSPFDDLIRMKDWDLFRDLSEEEALAPDLVERVVEGFRIGKPVNDFFNRVLDDTKIKSIF